MTVIINWLLKPFTMAFLPEFSLNTFTRLLLIQQWLESTLQELFRCVQYEKITIMNKKEKYEFATEFTFNKKRYSIIIVAQTKYEVEKN